MSFKTFLGKLRFAAYDFWFGLWAEKVSVDYAALETLIAKFNLESLFGRIEQGMQTQINKFGEGENLYYFTHLKTFDGRDKPVAHNPFPLFPPNLAVIDFLLKKQRQNTQGTDLEITRAEIVDYCCGFNNLTIILRAIGFARAAGYDNFAQIKEGTIRAFLEKFGLAATLKSKNEIMSLKTNVAICMCYYWNRIAPDIRAKEILNPTLEYIILDTRYTPPLWIKGFKIYQVYPRLVVVYKRKQPTP